MRARSRSTRRRGISACRTSLVVVLVRLRRREDLDAVLRGEVLELVRGAAGLDQVRGEQRVVAGVDAERLRIVDDEVGPLDARRARPDDDLVPGRDGRVPVLGGEADAPAQVERALAPGHLDTGHLHRRGRHRGVELVDAVQEVPELEAPEDLLELRAVGRREDELRRVAVDVEVAPHRREQLRDPRLVRVQDDVLPARRRQLVDVVDHTLERAVLRDELARGLVADPRHARDVVARVALQADEVRHLIGPDAVAGDDAVGRVDVDVGDAARRHHQADVVGAELERVAVGRDDAGSDAVLVRTRRERRDHVVGLPPGELEVPVAERLDDRAEVRELLGEQTGHRAPRLLVDDARGLRGLVPLDRPRVPRDRHPLRAVVGEQLEEHVRESEERVRGLPVRRRELLREREVRAIREVVAVDEEEVGLARGRVVDLQLGSRQRLRHEPTVSSGGRGEARDSRVHRGLSW